MANQVFRQEGMSQDQRAELARAQAAADQAAADLARARRQHAARSDAAPLRDGESLADREYQLRREREDGMPGADEGGGGDDEGDGIPDMDAEAERQKMVDRKTLAWTVAKPPRPTRAGAAPAPDVDPFAGETFDPAQHDAQSSLQARMNRGRRR